MRRRRGGDDYRKHLDIKDFINDFKKITETHSEKVTNFRKYSTENIKNQKKINYKDIIKYKKLFKPYENAFIKSKEDAINWVKNNRPEDLSDFLKEIKKAEEIKKDIPDGYIPFAIGYNGEHALKSGVTTRPLSVSFSGDTVDEGQRVVSQFGKNTGAVYINKDSYVLPIKNTKYSDREKELVIPIGSKIRQIRTGYTGFGTEQFDTYVDTPNILKTKSQLTDIWNKANGK